MAISFVWFLNEDTDCKSMHTITSLQGKQMLNTTWGFTRDLWTYETFVTNVTCCYSGIYIMMIITDPFYDFRHTINAVPRLLLPRKLTTKRNQLR